MSIQKSKKITEEKTIAEGAYSVVHAFGSDPHHVIKYYTSSLFTSGSSIKELAHMNFFNHFGIPGVELKNIYIDNDYLAVKLEKLIPIVNFKTNKDTNIRRFLVELGESLNYIHAHGIAHRDIKPTNIMFNTRTDRYQLNDWSSVSIVPYNNNPGELTTVCFLPPEWLIGDKNITGACDIWMLALTTLMIWFPMYTLYKIENPFVLLCYYYDRFDVSPNIRREKLNIRTNNELDSDVLEVLVDMLEFDPYKRITGAQIAQRLSYYEYTKYIRTDSCFIRKFIPQNMVKWAKDVAKNMGLSQFCLSTGLNIMSKVMLTDSDESSIFGATCMIISCSLHDEYFTFDSWVTYCNKQFDKHELLRHVTYILKKLSFNIVSLGMHDM